MLPGLINEQMEAMGVGSVAHAHGPPNQVTATGVFVHRLLPLCSALVADHDPIPQFTLALLLDIADVWPLFPTSIVESGVLPSIMAAAQKHDSPKMAALAHQISDLAAGVRS